MVTGAMSGVVSMGAGIVAAKLMGATWGSASLFMVVDWVVMKGADYLIFKVPPQVFSLALMGLIVINITGLLAGFHLNRYLFGKKNGIHGEQAMIAHTAAILFLFSLIVFASKPALNPSFS